MTTLNYRCPNTWQEVMTSIETDAKTLARLRDLKVSVACPSCIGGHMVPANQLYLGWETQFAASAPTLVRERSEAA
jgi:hypothetical protein